MKLFHMSILWRMGISSHPYYGFAKLGRDEELLRQMLLNGDPGEPWKYGCTVVLLRYRGKPVFGLFSQPRKVRFKRDDCLRLVLAGMQWYLYGELTRDAPVESFLTTTGEWALLNGELSDFKYLRSEVESFKRWSLSDAQKNKKRH
jgi:hypothetical protein